MSKRRLVLAVLTVVVLAFAATAAAVWWLNRRCEAPIDPQSHVAGSADRVARGAYLARLGDCASCHTQAGGAPYAGGRAIATPFGAIYTSNLTPDDATGIGRWNADEFWRALHNGRSRDGRLLYPAFPYVNYTHVTREDADALLSYLRSLPPVRQTVPAPALRFPYNTQAALAFWRALYFKPSAPDDAPMARGEYLARGLGHCAACHTPRDFLGGPVQSRAFSGALVPGDNWWAPSLVAGGNAGIAGWSVQEIAALLTTGVSSRGSVSGPMAEVVFASLQYLGPEDAQALAQWLHALPAAVQPVLAQPATSAAVLARGRSLYHDHCAECHGDEAQGKNGAFPPLAGNRAVRASQTLNLIQMVLHGGYQPATAGNPRPFGMPPFQQTLNDADVAAVLSFIRGSWDNQAGRVEVMDVHQAREAQGY